MLKRLLCQIDVVLLIKPVDPILIKSGYPLVVSKSGNMPFVRTYRNDKWEVFLPGSSLKGVIRSHAERICRTLKEKSVCLPYQKYPQNGNLSQDEIDGISCGNRFEKKKKGNDNKPPKNEEVYKYSCPACRMFGSTYFAGRCSISDAYAKGSAPEPELRDGVAIDRFTGGSADTAKFDLEVVTQGVFKTTITLRNFELWQVGLLGLILKDFEDEIIRIGSGKSRGLGRVKGEVESMCLTYFDDEAKLRGIAELVTEKERKDYGLHPSIPNEINNIQFPEPSPSGIKRVYNLIGIKDNLLEVTLPIFRGRMNDLNWLKEIKTFTGDE